MSCVTFESGESAALGTPGCVISSRVEARGDACVDRKAPRLQTWPSGSPPRRFYFHSGSGAFGVQQKEQWGPGEDVLFAPGYRVCVWGGGGGLEPRSLQKLL